MRVSTETSSSQPPQDELAGPRAGGGRTSTSSSAAAASALSPSLTIYQLASVAAMMGNDGGDAGNSDDDDASSPSTQLQQQPYFYRSPSDYDESSSIGGGSSVMTSQTEGGEDDMMMQMMPQWEKTLEEGAKMLKATQNQARVSPSAAAAAATAQGQYNGSAVNQQSSQDDQNQNSDDPYMQAIAKNNAIVNNNKGYRHSTGNYNVTARTGNSVNPFHSKYHARKTTSPRSMAGSLDTANANASQGVVSPLQVNKLKNRDLSGNFNVAPYHYKSPRATISPKVVEVVTNSGNRVAAIKPAAGEDIEAQEQQLNHANTLITSATSFEDHTAPDISPVTTDERISSPKNGNNDNANSELPPTPASATSLKEYHPAQYRVRRKRCLQVLVLVLLMACIIVIPTFLVPPDDAYAASLANANGEGDDDGYYDDAYVGDDDEAVGTDYGDDGYDDDETTDRGTDDATDDESDNTPPKPPPERVPDTRAFQTMLELHQAVDVYLNNPEDHTMIAMYGFIEHWDVSAITEFTSLFDAVNRNSLASTFNGDISQWDMSSATSLLSMFAGAAEFDQDISSWNVSQVTDMRMTFMGASSFQGLGIGAWDVGKVTGMTSMFDDALAFDEDISGWNVASLSSMANAFRGATSFSQNLCPWADRLPVATEEGDSSTVVATSQAFTDTACPVSSLPIQLATAESPDDFVPGPFCYPCSIPDCIQDTQELYAAVDLYLEDPSGASTANQYGHPIGQWCVNEVQDFSSIFSAQRNELAVTFNEPLDGWDTSSATNMDSTFRGAAAFNQDLTNFDMSQVTSTYAMFHTAAAFNGDISSWDLSNNQNTGFMFYGASSFANDLSNWNMGAVTNMRAMFWDCALLDSDVSQWDVSNVVNMDGVFGGNRGALQVFNSDLGDWDVSRVTDMQAMFQKTVAFDQDLSRWDVSRVTTMRTMFGWSKSFNHDLSDWDVWQVMDTRWMFAGSSSPYEHSLCDWGDSLPATAETSRMFFQSSSCPNNSDPVLNATSRGAVPGPFCHTCN